MEEGFGILKILVIIGSLGFFIYGMKIMSEGIQKLAGGKLRNILSAATSNRFTGVLTGFVTTSIIQSSSATTVMVVSFVNAGLLNLRQAIGVIMGANIGTTMTSFLLLVFGFGKFSISDYSFPIIAIGMPMLFINRSNIKSLGEFLIGFAILFMGLDALKESMAFVQDDPEFLYTNIVKPLSEYGYFSVLLFVLIGTILTIVVQSSSAAMALTITLCGSNGLSLEYGAAIILGENIGTTITANLAAMIGNVHAKRAARAHLFFNLIGVFWMLFIFYPFLNLIGYLTENTFLGAQITQGDPNSEIRWSLAVFHLVFNVINTLLLVWFVVYIEKIVTKFVPAKGVLDEEYHLEFIGGGVMSTAELSILEAQKEVVKFGDVAARMNEQIKKLLNSADKKEKKEHYKKIEKYEEITDRIEIELIDYLGKTAQLAMSKDAARKVGMLLAVASDLETIGDIYYQLAKVIEKKESDKVWFAPEQRNKINEMIGLLDKAFDQMNKNIDSISKGTVDINAAYEIEKSINKFRNEIRKKHLSQVDDSEYNVRASIIYSNLYSGLEKIGDHIVNVSETMASY